MRCTSIFSRTREQIGGRHMSPLTYGGTVRNRQPPIT